MIQQGSVLPCMGRIHPLDWDSQFFGMTIAELLFDTDQLLSQEAICQWDLLQAKLPSHDYQRIDMLQNNQFMLAESETEWVLALDNTAHQPQIRLARPSHLCALKQLAATAFLQSRYRQPWFTAQQTAQFYSQWVENALQGVFDDICLVYTDKSDEVQGLVTARLSGKAACLGLLAVLPQAQGKGIGRQLLQAAADWARMQGARQLSINTQLSNLAAFRFYSKMGAVLQSTLHCFYRIHNRGDRHDPF